VDRILAHVQGKKTEIIALIRRMVECESPSDDPRAVDRFVDLVAAEIAPFAAVETFPGGQFGKHLLCEFSLPGPTKKKGEILALGHSGPDAVP
jgi:glutamate carboxypeptidase